MELTGENAPENRGQKLQKYKEIALTEGSTDWVKCFDKNDIFVFTSQVNMASFSQMEK